MTASMPFIEPRDALRPIFSSTLTAIYAAARVTRELAAEIPGLGPSSWRLSRQSHFTLI
jgi:hypothetical protein